MVTREGDRANRERIAAEQRVAEPKGAGPAAELADNEPWPPSLQAAADLVLRAGSPMFVWWGSDLLHFHNDAMASSLGPLHARALGRPASEVWADRWPEISPSLEAVLRHGQVAANHELLIVREREGRQDEAYFTFSYGPILDDGGRVAGVLGTVTPDTERVLGRRRLDTLHSLLVGATRGATVEEVCELATAALRGNSRDLPFVGIYRIESRSTPRSLAAGERRAVLAALIGLSRGAPLVPEVVDLQAEDSSLPLREVAAGGEPIAIEVSPEELGPITNAAWPEWPRHAVVLPLLAPGHGGPVGFLVAGASSRLPFDEGYRTFLGLVAGQTAAAIAGVRERGAPLRLADRAAPSRVEPKVAERGLATQYAVARALAETESASEGISKVLRALGEHQGWRFGAFWCMDSSEGVLRCSQVQLLAAEDLPRFSKASRDLVLQPGAGLIGQVWVTGEAAWSGDVTSDPSFLRAEAASSEGLDTAFAFPIVLDGAVHGVVELVGRSVEEPDLGQRQMMTVVGGQLGLFVERLRVEDALRKSEERFVHFMQQVPGLVWIKDLQGRYVYINDAALRAFGAHSPQLFGRTDEEIFPPEVAAQFRENDLRALATETGIQVVETLEHEDGLHYSLVSKFPMPGPDARPAWVGGLAIDVTDRMRAEAALRESEERFRILADSSPVLIWVNDTEGCEFVNLTYLRFLGVAAEQVHGFGWLPFVHPEDRDEYLAAYARAVERRALFDAEFRFRRHDGEYRWMRSVGGPRYGPGGEFLGYCGSTFDVTDRRLLDQALRESEQRYRAIVESQAELICRFRPDGTILFVNGAYARAVGSTDEALTGRSLWDYVHPDDHPRVREMLDGLSPDSPEATVENRVSTREGDRWTLWTNRALSFDAAGSWTEAQAAGVDITQRKQMEEALRDADRRKDQFLATLAHELRNPLAPLRTALELIRLASNDPGTIHGARAIMERQLGQMVRLIDDLLDLSRISRGRITLRKERVSIGAVLQQAMETSSPAIEGAKHDFVFELPPEPIYLEADAVRLAQVFSNLLNNAAKFTEPGGRIVLRAEQQCDEVEITVQDDGIGIPAELMPRIFDVFTDVDRSLEQPKRGLGIGLSLVRSLVEMHGGQVEVRSEGHGAGSEFRVRLPIASVGGELGAPEVSSESPHARQRRILVVDDNLDAAHSLATLLGMLGNETRTAHDGLEAVELAAAFLPEVVLLDIGLPKLDGYEVARRIREQPGGADVLLVAVTGWGQDADRGRSQEAGFDFHLVKPVKLEALEQLLASRLGGAG